jgi:hypothetical protein
MQQPSMFQTTCKDGHLLVDQLNISVVAPFNRLVWSIPRDSVTNVVQKHSFLSSEVEIYSAHGIYIVKTLPKPKANEFAALLAQPPLHQSQPQQVQAPQTQSAGIPIDAEIQRVKLEVEQRRLHLREVSANMANIRSQYQQGHVHGGGKLGGFVRDVQRSGEDAKLRKQQPLKERLQREKLALEQQLSQLKLLKAQGVTHITPPIKAK